MLVDNGKVLETTKIQFTTTTNRDEGFGYCIAGAVSLKELTIFICRAASIWYNNNLLVNENRTELILSFKECVNQAVDSLGGALCPTGATANRQADAVYQIHYNEYKDEDGSYKLRINWFIYVNRQTQTRVDGSVYGYYLYNHLNYYVWCKPEMFVFDTSTDESGKLRNIKQYSVGVILDDIDKQLIKEHLETQVSTAEEKDK